METRDIIHLIQAAAKANGIDPNLAIAIAGHESNFNCEVVRYEPDWEYIVQVAENSDRLVITYNTELVLQKCSWGAMQIMGSVTRELGFKGQLSTLVYPTNGVNYGCRKLALLLKKYPNEFDAVSSYNQGSPKKESNGLYKNQLYVNDVMARLNRLRMIL